MTARFAALILAISACAPRHRLLRLDKQEPDEGVRNTYERCKPRCAEFGQRVIESWEDARSFRCHCIPWDA